MLKKVVVNVGLTIALIGGFTMCGLLAGVVWPVPNQWVPLGTSPAEVASLTILDEFRVGVETIGGEFYIIDRDGGWQPVDSLPDVDEDTYPQAEPFDTRPPGEVVIMANATVYPIPEEYAEVQVVVLEDGTLWRWHKGGGFYTGITRIIGLTVVGAVVGVVFAVVTNVVLVLLRRNNKTEIVHLGDV